MDVKSGFKPRDATEVTTGDYIKIRNIFGCKWLRIVSNTAFGAERIPRNWSVKTENGHEYSMWNVVLYAKAEDMQP